MIQSRLDLTLNLVKQPSLHEYSIFCNHIVLVDDYAIHYPIALCEPLNAKKIGIEKFRRLLEYLNIRKLAGLIKIMKIYNEKINTRRIY